MVTGTHDIAASASTSDRTLRCRTVAVGAERAATHLRKLPPFAVEEEFGFGPDAAPTSSELLLAVLARCLTDRLRAHALTGNIVISKLVLDVEARLAMGPTWSGKPRTPDPAGFEQIAITVHVDTVSSAEALRGLLSHAVLWSPVANSLHDPVRIDVALATPAASA